MWGYFHLSPHPSLTLIVKTKSSLCLFKRHNGARRASFSPETDATEACLAFSLELMLPTDCRAEPGGATDQGKWQRMAVMARRGDVDQGFLTEADRVTAQSQPRHSVHVVCADAFRCRWKLKLTCMYTTIWKLKSGSKYVIIFSRWLCRTVFWENPNPRLRATRTISSSLRQIFLGFSACTAPLTVWEQMSTHTHTHSLKPLAAPTPGPPNLFLIHIQPLWIGDRDIWLVLALHRLLCTADTNSELDLTLQFPADQQGWHNYYAGCATHRRRDTHSGVIQLQPTSVGENFSFLFFGGGTYAKLCFFFLRCI